MLDWWGLAAAHGYAVISSIPTDMRRAGLPALRSVQRQLR
jgi:hypothetical protein